MGPLLHLLFLSLSLLLSSTADLSPSGDPPLPSSAAGPSPSGEIPPPSSTAGPSPSGEPPHPSSGWAPLPAPEPHHMELIAPILVNLGYQELAMAVHSLYPSAWSGPVTLFAPSDDSFRSCAPPTCSPLRLLRDHLAPGFFSLTYLSRLPFGSKIQTASPGRCLTVTAAGSSRHNSSAPAAIFIDGVEITRPDLFNDGRMVIHGIQRFVAPLSPLSCVSGPSEPSPPPLGRGEWSLTIHLMLRDAIFRLFDGGYSVLALAIRIKYPELAMLHNMTVFAVDDRSVFYGGGHSYVNNVRFHVVPDRLLVHADLVRLPEGTVLPTLVLGQHLVVTRSAAGSVFPAWMPESVLRINHVPIKDPDVVYNSKIAVHGILMPFPQLFQSATPVPDEGELFDGWKVGSVDLDLMDDGF